MITQHANAIWTSTGVSNFRKKLTIGKMHTILSKTFLVWQILEMQEGPHRQWAEPSELCRAGP
ncbi:hypothetical protein L484_005894 [Morus notabilis]|uniref:Uncharacterized protein n=1 Tax=Morus notabilis TaxID=981085 RepID=W9QC85_9ROSA|nr:hypothetical protein L484_005894 [Morus notabilis]